MIEVVRQGYVRRSKLYYLRGTSGKKAKVRARVTARREYVKNPEKTQDMAALAEEEITAADAAAPVTVVDAETEKVEAPKKEVAGDNAKEEKASS